MKYAWLDEYMLIKPGARKDYKAEWEWERFLIRDKMFAAVCTPSGKYEKYAQRTLLTLKCDPESSAILRAQYADVIEGFYMDKRNWISIYTDGTVPEETVKKLCDMSYKLVLAGFSKKAQSEISQNI